jgi:hypothetical protein
MVLCQSWGLNGFKRKYRRMARHFLNWKLLLENELFDKYRLPAMATPEAVPYTAKDFKNHLLNWDTFLDTNIKAIAKLNRQLFDITSVENCIIEKALCCLYKNREKTGRYFRRFEEQSFNLHDIHRVDDDLHCHEKKKEEKEMEAWKK